MRMIAIPLPRTDDRTALLSRYTGADRDTTLLFHKLNIPMPEQPPPRIPPDHKTVPV